MTVVRSIQEVTNVVTVGTQGPQGPAGPGLSAGGSAGQYPRKASATDYDTSWADAPTMLADLANAPAATVFNADGSITKTYISGLVVTTTFVGNTVVDTYGVPVSKTKTTTFNADGSITESVA